MMLAKVAVLALFTIALSFAAQAEETQVCGPPPPPDVLKEISSKTKGDIEGKAQAISKVLGSAGITGKIESERRKLYQTTDQSERVRNDRYLFYVTCVLLMKDTSAPLEKKLEAIRALRSPLPQSGSTDEAIKKFLATFDADASPEFVRELLGTPKTRRTLTFDFGKTKKSYPMARYATENVDLVLVGSSPFRAIAVSREPGAKNTDIFPVPIYFGDDDGLGRLTLGDIKESCDGAISIEDAKFLFSATPACYFGRAGGYSYYVFGFNAGEAWDGCPGNLLDIDGKKFKEITCAKFWKTKPMFALVFLSTGDDSSADEDSESLAKAFASEVMQALYRPF